MQKTEPRDGLVAPVNECTMMGIVNKNEGIGHRVGLVGSG